MNRYSIASPVKKTKMSILFPEQACEGLTDKSRLCSLDDNYNAIISYVVALSLSDVIKAVMIKSPPRLRLFHTDKNIVVTKI